VAGKVGSAVYPKPFYVESLFWTGVMCRSSAILCKTIVIITFSSGSGKETATLVNVGGVVEPERRLSENHTRLKQRRWVFKSGSIRQNSRKLRDVETDES